MKQVSEKIAKTTWRGAGGKAWCDLAGIYIFRCKANGRVYIGSSRYLGRRVSVHLQRLRNGTHHSRKLQHCFDKYGDNAFEINILEFVPQTHKNIRDELVQREQFYIDFYDSASNGLNISPTASSTLGVKRTLDQRAAIGRRSSKRWRVYAPDGEIFEVEGLSAFCRTRNLNSAALTQVALGKTASHKGWRAEYWENPPFSPEHWQSFLRPPIQKKGKKDSKKIIYIITHPNGYEEERQSLSAFCAEQGLNHSLLYRVAKGYAQHHKGFTVCVKGQPRPNVVKLERNLKRWWRATSPTGEVFEFQNLKRFCLEQGITESCMHNVATGKLRQHKGWFCEMIAPPVPQAAD